ncbi:hypothetical protein [Thiocapsa roseopersicina]|uniref:hypothetical protein n=1 Tax=Thiocapsa roseopersicina TaxID=1058 RepID=UPI001FE02D97|nr:hypothetical protein [Thiocapsa roseopersicina]
MKLDIDGTDVRVIARGKGNRLRDCTNDRKARDTASVGRCRIRRVDRHIPPGRSGATGTIVVLKKALDRA